MRQLATIQIIKNIRSIPGRDRIQIADILGYNVIIGKDTYEDGQHVCFFEIDSMFPKVEFWKNDLEKFKYRIKTFKVNTTDGPVYGQGWCIPLDFMMKYIKEFKEDIYNKIINTNEIKLFEGFEVTEILDITKYDPELIENGNKLLPGNAEGNFPSDYIAKTDETRCLPYDSIIFTDNGYLKIGDIIEKQINCLVLTYNSDSKKLEFKKIIGSNSARNNNNWYHIECVDENNNIIKIEATSNHMFYLPEFDIYRRLDQLTPNDSLLFVS